MKKNKLNYDAAIKQMDMLLPEELLEENKQGITVCKEAGQCNIKKFLHQIINIEFEAVGVKEPCEAAFVLIQCMYKNNKKFMFP